ncbi:hypothetical protein Syun_029509 [Stephania yunnanensis]|uniref:Uncharacterized protein n=1 Tax=Stephania yunnanensis TaxID=152371 RepID=A0AAP0E5H9_9MAGN
MSVGGIVEEQLKKSKIQAVEIRFHIDVIKLLSVLKQKLQHNIIHHVSNRRFSDGTLILTAASALAGDRTRDAGGSRQPEMRNWMRLQRVKMMNWKKASREEEIEEAWIYRSHHHFPTRVLRQIYTVHQLINGYMSISLLTPRAHIIPKTSRYHYFHASPFKALRKNWKLYWLASRFMFHL